MSEYRRVCRGFVLAGFCGVLVLCVAGAAYAQTMLLSRDSTGWKYLPGTAEASEPRGEWRDPDFDDSGWSTGQAPVGYGGGQNTTIPGMQGTYSSFYLRKTFPVSSIPSDMHLRAAVNYDDGFIMWINGRRVLDRNEPDGEPVYFSLADDYHSPGVYDPEDLGDDGAAALEVGENVLAVQVFNRTLDSSDCLFDAELTWVQRVADTHFSHDRGFYESSFTVTITTATSGATIRYTTDGSVPTLANGNGTGTNETVTVSTTTCLRAAAFKGDHESTDVDTQTYIFLDDVLQQSATVPAGYPSTWGDHSWGPNGYADYGGHAVIPADHEMDPEIVTNASYSGMIKDALKSLPTLSIVMDKDEMFVGSNSVFGIDAAHDGGEDYKPEFSTSIEVLHANAPEDDFQADSGIQRHGRITDKRAFRLEFKSELGDAKLREPFFASSSLNADSAVDRFDRIVLRPGMNKTWPAPWNAELVTYTRDEWVRDSQVAMRNGRGVHGTFMHLYINGMYWGLYNTVERPDAWFTSAYWGGEMEDWYARNMGGTLSGDDTRWNYLVGTLRQKDMSSASNYAEMKEYLDVEQFSDYLLLLWYMGMRDWPGNNWYAGMRTTPPGPARFFVWDAEGTFNDLASTAWVSPDFRLGQSGSAPTVRLWHSVRYNKDFMTLFADRVYENCFNDGPLVEPTATQRWNTVNQQIEDAIVCESARWGDCYPEPVRKDGDTLVPNPATPQPPYTREDHWREATEAVRGNVMGNVGRFITALRTETYYPTIDPPEFQQHGGAIGAGFQLTMTNPNASGTIYYETDGSDPRADGGSRVGTVLASGGSIPLTRTTHVKARVWKTDSTWSAVHAATFNYTAHYPNIRITEIMYNPLGGAHLEFVEICNVGGLTVGLSDVRFDKGIRYTFPPGTELGAGQYLVLAADATQFARRYGSAPYDVYEGKLDNGGERLTLSDCDGETITSVRYNDKLPWPEAADGDGFSLVFAGTGDQDDAAKWRKSNLIGGSPGYADGDPYDVVINEALTHTDLPSVDAIELHNRGTAGVNIGGWWLSDDATAYRKFQIPATELAAGGYVVFDETDFNTDTNDPACFALSSHGDEVYLTKFDANTNLQYLVREDFGGAANGVAFGLHKRTDGVENFVAQSVSNTLGSANAYPLIGPVVINELMYHSAAGALYDYVELYNRTGISQPLYNGTNGWQLEGTGYQFPTNTTLAPYEYVLVVRTNETAFRAQYTSVPGGVRFFGPFPGRLENDGESVRLERPDDPDPEGVPWILVDRVEYNDNSPWPESADGDGPSLERLAPSLYGNDPANWAASEAPGGTPGAENSGLLVSKTAGWWYHDLGQDLGTVWRAAGYDDSAWEEGNAPLGYKYPTPDPAIDTEMDFGDDPANKYPTTYFRTRFMFDGTPGDVTDLQLHVRHDDGFVAYLNGTEVARGGMAGGAVSYSTLATGSSGTNYPAFDIIAHKSELVQGVNVLAVEVHQVNASSSDLFLDLDLVYDVAGLPTAAAPQFSPPHNTSFTEPSLNVTVSTATSGATVFYTTDGSTPTTGSENNGTASVIVNLTGDATIKAFADKDTHNASDVAQATYDQDLPDAATPTITPNGGPFYASISVTVSTATAGATVFYTTDGSAPSPTNNDGSGVDSANFSLTQTRTIKACAYKATHDTSGTATATFTESTPTVGFENATESGSESVTNVTLTVELSASSAQTVTVDYQATGGSTASPGSDFVLAPGTLTFSPGQTTKQIAFTVDDDRDIEDNETVVVQLSNESNANMGTSLCTYTITDNDLLFVAYNDLAWVAGDPTNRITRYSNPGTTSGLLVDYNTGEDTAVTLSVSGGGGVGSWDPAHPDSGTDAHAIFDGKVGCDGFIAYAASNLTLNVSGLDAGLQYELVVFGNRGVTNYTDRDTTVLLTGIEPGFRNTSSVGTEKQTNTLSNDTTVVCNGFNTVNGHVARFSRIDAGSDGEFTVTISDNVTKFYANALMLRALEPALPVSVVAKGATWKYRDTGENLGTAWRAAGYNDSGWAEGPAGLGYPVTKPGVATVVSYGPDSGNKYITTYCRTRFTLDTEPSKVVGMLIDATYDDGYVAYLNGTEIARGGMPTGTINYDTLANVPNGSQNLWEEQDVSAYTDELVQGENVLAIEFHQIGAASSDTMIDAELIVEKPAGQETVVKIANGADWRYRKGTAEASDPATDWRTVTFDDAGWSSSAAPFGYGPLSYGTTLSDMQGSYPSVFLRKAFSVVSPGLISRLNLSVDYDDGFIAWLNGEEIARVNVQGEPGSFVAHSATCSGYVSANSANFNQVYLGGDLPELAIDNVLAVQMFNNASNSGDAMLEIELSVLQGSVHGTGVDADQDGMPDDWETARLSGTGSTSTNDTDGDGLLDVDEYVEGSDPTNATSFFGLDLSHDGANLLVSFTAREATGTHYDGLERRYTMEARPQLDPNQVWTAVPGYSNILGQGQSVVYTNTNPAAHENYRGRVWLE